MMRKSGFTMGSLFLFGGLLGFVPGVVKGDMYLGIFMVNTPHNLLHIASGIAFLAAALFSENATRWWFRIFGTFYGVLTIMGFVTGDGMIFGLISNNRWDAWGHAGLSLIMLLISFALPRNAAAS